MECPACKTAVPPHRIHRDQPGDGQPRWCAEAEKILIFFKNAAEAIRVGV